MRQLESPEARFAIENPGERPLRISRISADCGCIVPAWKNKDLPPGAKETLTLAFKTGNLEGRKDHSASLYLADPATSKTIGKLELRVHCNVIPDVSFTPSRLDFGDVAPTQPVSTSVTIRKVALRDSLITLEPLASHESISVQPVAQHEASPDRVKYKVTFDPRKYPARALSAELSIGTNSKAMRSIKIPVSARVIRSFRVEPNSVVFSAISDNSGSRTREISILADRDIELTDVNLRYDETRFSVSRLSRESNGRAVSFLLELRLDSTVTRSFEDRMIISLNGKDEYELRLGFLDLRP